MKSYFDENMRLLQDGSMNALFGPAPIYTKIRDDNPTRYLQGSSVKNSLLADGCVIEGTVGEQPCCSAAARSRRALSSRTAC